MQACLIQTMNISADYYVKKSAIFCYLPQFQQQLNFSWHLSKTLVQWLTLVCCLTWPHHNLGGGVDVGFNLYYLQKQEPDAITFGPKEIYYQSRSFQLGLISTTVFIGQPGTAHFYENTKLWWVYWILRLISILQILQTDGYLSNRCSCRSFQNMQILTTMVK